MAPLVLKEYLESSIGIMSLIGSWPKLNPSRNYQTYTIVVAAILIINTASCMAAQFTDLKTENAIYGFCLLLAFLNSTGKMSILNFRKTRFLQIMDFFDNPLFTISDDLNHEITGTMRISTFFRRLLFFFIMVTAALTILNPLIASSLEPTPIPLPFDVKQQPFIVYIIVVIIQSVGAFLLGVIIASCDGLVIMLMAVAITQLNILKIRITNAFDLQKADSLTPQEHNDLVNKKLKSCVIHFILIEEYVRSIEDMFNMQFLIQMVISLIGTVFIGFNVFITSINSPTLFGKTLFYFISTICELSIFCVPGNEITYQSGQIRDACYMANWIECDSSVRKTLFILMERSKRPLQLTAGKFIFLSLDTLLRILKSSFSYFMVLRNMYSK